MATGLRSANANPKPAAYRRPLGVCSGGSCFATGRINDLYGAYSVGAARDFSSKIS